MYVWRLFHKEVKQPFFFQGFPGNVFRNQVKPKIPAKAEAINIVIFALLIKRSSSNASREIKMDMVKPMPPNSPAPATCFHFKSLGRAYNPSQAPNAENKNMPIGLPKTNPVKIPTLLTLPRP